MAAKKSKAINTKVVYPSAGMPSIPMTLGTGSLNTQRKVTRPTIGTGKDKRILLRG